MKNNKIKIINLLIKFSKIIIGLTVVLITIWYFYSGFNQNIAVIAIPIWLLQICILILPELK